MTIKTLTAPYMELNTYSAEAKLFLSPLDANLGQSVWIFGFPWFFTWMQYFYSVQS